MTGIVAHSHRTGGSFGRRLFTDEFKVWVYGFHMPLFFIISGYSFGMFEEKKYSNWSIKDLIKKKAKAYFVPHLCFFA